MADNVTINAMSGGDTIAADDIAGIKYQRMKMTWGADGTATDVSSAAPIPVAPAAASTVGTAAATVATAGTAQRLATHTCTSVTVRALATNMGTVYLGAADVTSLNGFPLAPGDAISMDVTNTDTLYLNATANADGARYLWVSP